MEESPTGEQKKAWPFRKPILRLTLFVVLIAFVFTTETCHNRLFLFPSTTIEKSPADYRLASENVTFKNPAGKELAGWLCPAQHAIGTVVLNHGNTGNIGGYIDYARLLTEAGVSVLLYDYQGFGNSQGKASISSLIGDGLAAFDYLVSRKNTPGKIAVMGVSLGTTVSCAVIRRRPQAAALILEGAFLPETELYWRMGTLGAPVAFIVSKSLPPIAPEEDIAALDGRPLLMVHGAQDRTTPLYGAAQLFERAKPPKWFWVMDGVRHFPEPVFYRRKSYQAALTSFLRHVFLGESFDQPRVVDWAATQQTDGSWRVTAHVQVPHGSADVVVVTEGNKAVRKKTPFASGSGRVEIDAAARPVTVSAFAEPQAGRLESGAQ
jgi:pimeloyl-ACP methyl ester carboxylesterase